MKKALFLISFISLFSCDKDYLVDSNLTGDFLNTYHLMGEMILYDSGQAIDTVVIDETQAPSYGSFGDQNLTGFIGSFTGGISILFGLPLNRDRYDNIKAEMLPAILNKETYPMLSWSSKLNEDFMSASLLYSGTDKNYNYDVVSKTVFTIDSIYLASESVFQVNPEIETVSIYVGNFQTMLKLSLNPGDTKNMNLPDSIELRIESVKGFLN
ncbi:MAG: hypothetical protein AB8B73_12160 [Ekhidna sp.]